MVLRVAPISGPLGPTQINGLPAASALTGAELFPAVQGGMTVKTPLPFVGTAVYNLAQYFAANGGAYDGTTDCTAAWNAAITAIGSSQAVLIISGQAAFASSPSTAPSTLVIQFIGSGQVLPATTKVVTINGQIVAAPVKIFGGAGTIGFNAGSFQHTVYPEWWGAIADNSTEAYAALQSANVAANAINGGEVILGSGGYKCSTTLNILNQTSWIGKGKFGSQITLSGSAQIAILGSANAGGFAFRIFLRDMTISAAGTSATAAVNINTGYTVELERVHIPGVETVAGNTQGIYTTAVTQAVTRDVSVYGTNGTGYGIFHDTGSLEFQDLSPDMEFLGYGINATGAGTSGDIVSAYMERGGGITINRTGAGKVNIFGGFFNIPTSSYYAMVIAPFTTNVHVYSPFFNLVGGAHGLLSQVANAQSPNLNVYGVPQAQIEDPNGSLNKVSQIAYVAGVTGAAPVPDLGNGAQQSWTLSASTTWGIPLHPLQVGQILTLLVTANGVWTTAWNAIYRNAPAWAASANNQKATANFMWDGTSWQFLGGSTAFA